MTRRPPKPQLRANIGHPVTAIRRDYLPFGVTDGDRLVAWHLSGSAPHCLVVGRTGAGKSIALLTIVTEACRQGIEVHILDPKRTTFRGMLGWPGVVEVATRVDTMVAAIDRAHTLMEDRYRALESGAMHSTDLDVVLLVIDELTEFVVRLTEAWEGRGVHPAITQWRSLVRLGRQARVHLLCGIQRPDAAIITGETRSNFGLAIGIGDLTREAQAMIGCSGNVVADTIGRAVVVSGTSEIVAQIWRTPDPASRPSKDDRLLLEALRPENGPTPKRPVPAVLPGVTASPDVSGTPLVTAPDIPVRVGRTITNGQVATMRRLSKEGVSNAEIARRLGVSRPAVVAHLKARQALHLVDQPEA